MNKLLGGRLLGRFSKSSNEEVRLTLHNWGVGETVDVRVFAKIRPSDDSSSQPTELGFSIDVDLLPDLKRVIDTAIIALGEDAEGRGEARPAKPEGYGNGCHRDESGTSRPAGEKRRATIDQDERTPGRDRQGQGQSTP